MDIKTIFDGWGTELISILIGLCLAGAGLWCYKKGKVTQKQKAGNNVEQEQKAGSSDEKEFSQSQEAGDDAKQKQVVD